MNTMSNFKDTNSIPDGYRALNTSELQELLQDEEKMDQIVRLNEKFQELQVDREILLTSNRSLAEESLARRPLLNNGKLQLAEKYRDLTNLATACWEKQSRLEADIQKHSLQTAQNLLQEDVVRAEEQSEDLLEKFMEGNVPLEGFLDSFQSSRKSYHIRRAQAEKIQELNRAKRNSSKPKKPEDKMRDEKPEPQRTNGFMAQGPPRVFQLRYGLTPAILLPHFPLPSSSTTPPSALTHTSLPPLDSQPGQTQILSPSAPLSGHGHPVNLRVIGQLPGGWSTRPMRLQQLYRPAPHQPEPPYR
ncbi:vacuolar protein sorting-associated protein 37D isoform X1 [Oncorhynchus kisutch]|uniref:VPS37D subunit of ESCRT-I n=1 Tax=Oncorhynchus kisutch TaxID=8019 RepID=A0A8C7KVA6_ONCKI|nr:vacuolar protein sorting-associated protein 37D isoform X1 [Oncorhynchus kisutch]XP_020320219.1 vacuolar protein sorting-associated protein 37D isoform X1 [Oncorhynchus kisutch]